MYDAVVVANRRAGAGTEQVDAHARRLQRRIRAEAGRCEYIDVGRVNGEPLLCASMLGMTTTLAQVREEARGSGALRLGARMAVETLRLLRNYPAKRVRLSAHGETLNFRTRALVVSNNPVLAELRPVPRRPRLDTGELGVYGVRAGPLYEWPRLVWRLLSGSWPEDPRLFHYRARVLSLDTWRHRKVTVLNDGERLRLQTPLRYELLPLALSVLAPAEAESQGRADGGTADVDATTAESRRAPDPAARSASCPAP